MDDTTTPFELSPVIVGMMRLGEWGAKLNTKELEAFVEQCLDMGLCDFDHADIYGSYTTEDDFGKLLKNRPDLRSRMRLTSKASVRLVSEHRPAHRINYYDSSKAHLLDSVDQSLKALATDHLDLFLIHRPDYLMNPEDVAEVFDQLHSAGKVKHFGVSNYAPAKFALLQSYSSVPLVTNQVEISILQLNAFTDGTLDQCLQHKIRPTAWSPFGGGAIFQNSEDEQIIRIKTMANKLAEKYNVDMDQVLLAWLFKHPSGIVPVLGTSKINRVVKALEATKIELTHQEWYELLEASTGVRVP